MLERNIVCDKFWTGFNQKNIIWYVRISYIPGPLFTKRWDVLPQDLEKSRSREIRV